MNQKSSTQPFQLIAMMSLCASFWASFAQAAGERTMAQHPGSVQLMRFLKHGDEKAKHGLCVAPPKGNPESVLRRAGVTTSNAKSSEVTALARGVQQISALAGENGFVPLRGAKVRFSNSPVKATGVASGGFDGTNVNIRRSGSSPATNVAHLMHELGHHVGNQQDIYARYRRYVSRPCQFTLRCRHVLNIGSPRNEEFAEVFASFVLHPELLTKSGPNCKRALDFFAREIFPRGRELARCGATMKTVKSVATSEVKAPVKVAAISPDRVVGANGETCERGPSGSGQLLSLGERLRSEYPASE